jgi:small-conductance mechanosensitive channel
MVQDWSTVTLQALQNLWQGFLRFIPKLIGGVVVFVIGWFVSVWIGKLVAEILRRVGFDKIFEKTKWEEALQRAELKMKMSDFIGAIVKWVLVIVFLLAAVRILVGAQYTGFFSKFVEWLPNLVAAAAIFVVAVIVAEFSEKLVKAIVGKMNVSYVGLVGAIVKWSIWIFAILAILAQLGVAPDIIHILITGFVALVVISCSLAFGLGGKDLAKEFLEGLRDKFRK